MEHPLANHHHHLSAHRPAAAMPLGVPGARGSDPARLLMRVLDEIDYGLMLVDESARLLIANQVALRACGAGDAVQLRDGVVGMHRASDQQALLKALWAARRGVRSLLQLSTPSGEQMVAVVPLDDGAGAANLLVFGRQQLCEPLSMDFFSRTHGLSHAENAVLRGLCSGLFPQQIARQVGVANSTVRTQISSIRAKTGTRSIRQLIARLTALPPIVPMLHPSGTLGGRDIGRFAA